MAQVTFEIVRFLNGQVVGSCVYDDRKMTVVSVALANNSDRTAYINVTDTATGQSLDVTCAPGQTLSRTVPRSTTFTFVIDDSGQLTFGSLLITATFG